MMIGHKFVEDEDRTKWRPHPDGGHRWVGRCKRCNGVGYLYGYVDGPRGSHWQHKPVRNRAVRCAI